MAQIQVQLVVEAEVCEHCDTSFGLPVYLKGHPFYCPLGHRNEARAERSS